MNVCSLLPSATEILCLLGLTDAITGITHECDFPPEILNKRVLTRCVFDSEQMDAAEIDQEVRQLSNNEDSLYRIDTEELRLADPDLIITQDLCHVCAITPSEVFRAVRTLQKKPEVIQLNPKTLEDILADIRTIGNATGIESESCVKRLEQRIRKIAPAVQLQPRPTVACIEWFQPLWSSGHWVPEMVGLAGGVEVLARIGEPSRRVDWEELKSKDPDVVICMPCGYDLQRVRTEFFRSTNALPWSELKAYQTGNLYLVDAGAYFSRPGPRVVEGLEILAEILHPEYFASMAPYNSYTHIR
jgi:iron complex transport system substrate-binding protein